VTIGGVRHAKGSLILAAPTVGLLQYELDEKAAFFKEKARARGPTRTSCPKDLAARLIDAATELGFRQCVGIVGAPLFQCGEIVAESGYHEPTGIVVNFDGPLPAIPAEPTRADALAALDVMLRPFRGYLSDDNPRLQAGIAAAALTAVARASLPTAPALAIDASVPGAGKGKLARALSVLATGGLPAIVTEGHSDEETEKRIASAVLSCAQCVVMDNLQRALASSTLESGLTEGTATIRLFGQLTDMTVPFRALVIITTNNGSFRADMLRRTLPVRIVVDTDEPEKRQFGFDPYLEAKRDRLPILAAAFTILRAWWLAREAEDGRRIRQTTLGSFEQWAELVAGAVEWVTGTNPIALIEERKAEDPGRGEERQVIAALRELFRTAEWTAKEAVGRPAPLVQAYDDPPPATGLDPDLWRGVLEFKGERPNPVEVGKWLGRQKDKVFGNLQLCSHPGSGGTARWGVRDLAEKGRPVGSVGSVGSIPPSPREMSKNTSAGVVTIEEKQGQTTQLDPTDPTVQSVNGAKQGQTTPVNLRSPPAATIDNCVECHRPRPLDARGFCEGCAAGERMPAEAAPKAVPESVRLGKTKF
jgi:hypothetical protein